MTYITRQIIKKSDSLKSLIVKHLTFPVLFTKALLNIEKENVFVFVELGEKTTVSSLVKKTLKNAKTLNVSNQSSFVSTLNFFENQKLLGAINMQQMFGLLGFPVNGSFSQLIHNRLFEICKKNAKYFLLNTPPDKINDFRKEYKNFSGFNVTMPYKNTMFNLTTPNDYISKKTKTVNTILKNPNNEYFSYNTDYYGFFKSLEVFNINLQGTVLLLGLGGAGKIVALYSVLKGCNLTVAVRKNSFEKAKHALSEIIPEKFNKKLKIVDIKNIPQKVYRTIINATPIGMHHIKNNMPIEKQKLFGCLFAIDLIYNPYETQFLKAAKKFKIKTVNGLYMLLFQAIASNQMFSKTKFKKEVVFKLAKEVKKFFI